MRSTLLAGCVLCLATFAASALPQSDKAATTASTGAAIEQRPPASAPAETMPVADATACVVELQGPGGAFPSCGSPCTPPPFWNRAECVGYDCRGILTIDLCSCVNSRWTCEWQEVCR